MKSVSNSSSKQCHLSIVKEILQVSWKNWFENMQTDHLNLPCRKVVVNHVIFINSSGSSSSDDESDQDNALKFKRRTEKESTVRKIVTPKITAIPICKSEPETKPPEPQPGNGLFVNGDLNLIMDRW